MFIYSIDTQSYNKRSKGLSQIFLTSKKKIKNKKNRTPTLPSHIFISLSLKGERGRDYFLIIDDCTIRYVSLTTRCASRTVRKGWNSVIYS